MDKFNLLMKRAFEKHGGVITNDVCKKHGCNKIIVNSKTVCPECKKEQDDIEITQNFYENEKAYKKRIHEKIVREFLYSKSIMAKNLKNSTLDMSFDNYYPNTQEQTKNVHIAKNLASEYNNGAEGNAFIVGKAGRGKTHLAMSILKEFKGKSLFVSLTEMFNLIQRSYRAEPDYPYTKDYFYNLLDKADLVVLDDLGAESSIKNGRASGSSIRDIRDIYDHCKRVITTSNLQPIEIQQVYTTRASSVVFAGTKSSENRIVKFETGHDYRLGGN